jgi:hypothetical protein
MSDQITSLARLAKAVGRSKSTAHAWTKHPLWEWPRVPPWPAGAVDDMKDWAAANLRPVRSDAGEDDGFWSGLWIDYPALPPLPEHEQLGQPVTALPAALVGRGERDVLAGRRVLTADEVRDVVAAFARYRARTADLCRWLPSWLAGRDAGEIAKRLRSQVYEWNLWISGVYDRFRKPKP